MLDKGKISAFQLGVMMYPTVVVTGILLLPSLMAKIAGKDMWLAPLWGFAGGAYIVFLCHWLHAKFPEQTIVQYSEQLLGKSMGKLCSFLVIWFYLQLNGYVVREYGEFLVGAFFQRTPILLIMGSIILVSACAVRGGIEVLARSAILFVPVVALLFLLVLLFLSDELDVSNIFPILENGVEPSLKGAFISFSGWYGEFFVISFLLPSVYNRTKGMKWGIISLILVMFTMMITNLVVLLLLGDIASHVMYPVLLASRYIEYANFLEHVEAVVMAIWILGVFIKISMFYYAVVLGASQWMKLSDYRVLVFPVGLLILLFSIWGIASLREFSFMMGSTGPFYDIAIQFFIPSILAAAALFNKSAHTSRRM